MLRTGLSVLPSTLRGGAAIAMLLAIPLASAATRSVGPGKPYASPCLAFANAVAGDVVEIEGGTTYSRDVCYVSVSNLTIRGVNGRPRIDAAGANAGGKGTWVIAGNNVSVDNVEMLGAKVPDQNGAALRLEGVNFTLRNSFIHDNENGILSGALPTSNIVIENTEFGHNGFGTGYTHNLYIGNVASLTFRFNYSHDANVGHNLKSRAAVNTIISNRFSSTPPGTTGSTASGQPSYEIDLPNAGTSYIIGNVIEQPAANQNPAMLAYGEEGASNPGKDLYIVNNTFLNDDTNGGTFVQIGSGVSVPALIQNNIFAGSGTLTNQAGALLKTNYRNIAPGFVNRAQYDLHPTANILVVDAGSAPGTAQSGVSLTPVFQYKHVAGSEGRPQSGALDIGAYEAATASVPAPVPDPVPSWTPCAQEGGICAVSTPVQVRYGAAGGYFYKTTSSPIACSNSVFGDPTPGVVKTCSYAPAVQWTPCAQEGGVCAVPGSVQVRYGAAGQFVIKATSSSIACTNSVFGDPAPGIVKACTYAAAAH